MKKKGFTLIELLAVIVILAIIALIATPIILNMINSAKKSSARSSALGYIDAIEYNNGFAEVEQPGYTSVIGENLNVSDISIKVKGKKPSSGTVTVNSKGKVESADGLCFNGYRVDYDGKDAKVKGKCSGGSTSTGNFGGTLDKSKQYSSSNVEQLGLKGVAYLDPTDLEATCTSSSEITSTNIGCKKFYIYDDSGSTYKMIMDRNITEYVAYETSGTYKEYDQASIKKQVDIDTKDWIGNPRLISADEVVTITNAPPFDGGCNSWFYLDGTGTDKRTKPTSSMGTSPYAWLFDYTRSCTNYGCNVVNSIPRGYWTNSPTTDLSNRAWFVNYDGGLSNYNVDISSDYGIRPVITIEKSKLQ